MPSQVTAAGPQVIAKHVAFLCIVDQSHGVG